MGSVGIIDYRLCNLDSIRRAVELCGAEPTVTDDPERLAEYDRLILPGVGSFATAMRHLRERGLDQAIVAAARSGIPLLGICLGMQLLADDSEEGEEGAAGLGLVSGHVVKLATAAPDERVPHIGWNSLNPHDGRDALLRDLEADQDFYFVHSFHLRPADPSWTVTTTPYCGGFTSIVRRDNVCGTQFHPEKSQRSGLKLLTNFLDS